MKKTFFLLLAFFAFVKMQAFSFSETGQICDINQSAVATVSENSVFLGSATFDSTLDKPFTYSNTFSNYSRIELNIPFADYFYISGSHVEFTISKENMMWHLFKGNNDYYDLQISLYGKYSYGGVGILRIYIIR